MSIQELLYRRDMIMESIDFEYDYGIICEGFIDNAKETFSKIKKWIIDFFNNLIKKVKDFFRRKTIKKINTDEIREKILNSNKKLSKPVNLLKDGKEIEDYFYKIINIDRMAEGILNKWQNEYLKELLNYMEFIEADDSFESIIKRKFFSDKKTTNISDFNPDIVIEYYYGYKDTMNAIEKVQELAIYEIEELEKKSDFETYDSISSKLNIVYENKVEALEEYVKVYMKVFDICEKIIKSVM